MSCSRKTSQRQFRLGFGEESDDEEEENEGQDVGTWCVGAQSQIRIRGKRAESRTTCVGKEQTAVLVRLFARRPANSSSEGMKILCALFLMSSSCLLPTSLSSQEITFLEPGSFVELDAYSTGSVTPAEVARSGISFEFSVMTDSMSAILLYAAASESQQMSSIASRADANSNSLQQQHRQLFIAAEVINGKTVLSMNDGSGVVTLASEVIVNDGVWHRVNAIFSSSHMEVNVDGNSKLLRPSSSDSGVSSSGVAGSASVARMPKTLFEQIDFSSVYVGGMHAHREYNALQQGINSINSMGSALEASLIGCVKEMKLNRKVIGIKSGTTYSTKGTCGYKFMCLLSDPCIDEADCIQEGLDGFHCVCELSSCIRRNQSHGAPGSDSHDQLPAPPEINVHEERGSSDKDREVSSRRAEEQGIPPQLQQQTNYRQRNHHRQRGSSAVSSATVGGSLPSSSSSSSLTTALSPTASPSLTKGLSLGASVAATAEDGNSGKGSLFPVNHLSFGWKEDVTVTGGSQAETNQMPHQQPALRDLHQSSKGSTSVQHPASFVSYLGTVISKEQAITCFIVAVISLLVIVLVAMVRGFYLYGRRKENRRQTHKDLNLHSSNSSNSSNSGGRKDSETTTSACTPLPLGSDFDDPSDLLSHPSDLISPPSISSRMTADFPDHHHLQQPVAPPVHNYSTFGRSINRRDSSLFLPLPPPSFYFTNTASSFSDLPSSPPYRFSEYRD